MDWHLLAGAAYILLVLFVCFRILYDTHSSSKTLAYLLVTILVPGVGIIIYFAVGANYRKNKLYSKKIINDNKLLAEIREKIIHESEKTWDTGESEVKRHKKLARMLLNDNSPLTGDNEVNLLLNGEEKFPEVIQALKDAKHHIHIEYYIFENDAIGNIVKDVLIQKAAEGVQVRFIYDDFGSRSIRHNLVKELIAGGVEAYPFYKILFIALSNRTNYRNHRKIIVIDGCTAFIGGINVSDRYINNQGKKQLFWRDTHVRINGPGVYYLQYLFICDWNFAADQKLPIQSEYFCSAKSKHGKAIVQIAASGPDSDTPTIMFSLLQTIGMAQEELLITSPYFIPGESILNALSVAALSGVKIKLLVPNKSDSAFINAAARSYYGDILDTGAEIYLYKKGFVHAKTIVSDSKLAIVGSANMDHRSFELNFEVNSMIYDDKIALQLREAFYNDIKDAVKINPKTWAKRTLFKQLPEKLIRLLSPLL
ncbi:cardiolipin synthase [Mucilaginibacter flavidus]|uniref:cardiolipin synthase n=1 Tax=Mucilaginibacter flavidus TaxID=2949309 RepID=UPI0020928B03|nr:cardiolipin synthase [Mucilaginibacter flavidus]MCO5949612.1 cardiolipin synthase [Mucilaginibacter flavidus]